MIALRYLTYLNYFILYVLSDTEIIVEEINIYSDNNSEQKNECCDSHLLALGIKKENYNLFKSKFFIICKDYIIFNNLNEVEDLNFYQNYIKKIIKKIRSFSVYESEILLKCEMIKNEAKNAQRIFYFHLCLLSYEFIDFWYKILSKHIMSFDSSYFIEIFEHLIFNEDIFKNSIYKNIYFDPDVRFERGLIALEK
ncbi:hypothetical protein GVAV_002261 [Gurleya vavrai]